MKVTRPIFLSVMVALVFVVLSFLPRLENTEKESILLKTIVDVVEAYHFDPLNINDEFSEKVFNLYIDRIDRGRRWLTQEDMKTLSAYKLTLDDEIRQGKFDFLDISVAHLEKGVNKTETFYKEILGQPFDFTASEIVITEGSQKGFAADDKELREFWRKNLKYEVMTRLVNLIEEQEKLPEEKRETEAQLEEKARKKVLDLYDGWYKRMAKLERHDRTTAYLNAITNVFDPHTSYYEPVQKQSFDIEFGGKLEGIGARLQEDDIYTKIVGIVVGGPAWKTKQLEEGDMIMKVTQADNTEGVDIKGMRVDDVVQLIRGKKGTKVRLTVKKADGSILEVPILRDIIVLEEKFAKSLIVEGEEQAEIGYIYLPGFYADFEDKSGRFCADDVTIELEKLKKEGVKGIILDLRDNGGGSLDEVRKMSGLFIEQGPVVQVKSRDRRPEVLSDTDNRVQYSGPLIVMVNNFSASASEILAAALQDYDRALIVGSTKTHGKGTVQRFIDLDRTVRGSTELKPLGHIKLTMQKYYGVAGKSVQLTGVIPDIVLPDYLHYVTTGERDYEYAMDWSKIDAVPFNQEVYKIKNKPELKKRSESRVANDSTFQAILEYANWIKEQQDKSEVSLNLKEYQSQETKRNAEVANYRELMKKEYLTKVRNLTIELADLVAADESKKARNEDFINTTKKDIHLREAIAIMQDMIATHSLVKR